MSPRFLTLMHREWLQYRTGWLVLMVAPALLLLALSFFDGGFQLRLGDQQQGQADVVVDAELTTLRQMPPLLTTGLMTVLGASATLSFALLSVLFQLPGLARRDEQDRSIEFWRALPVSDVQSLGAMLLTHLLVVPWAALVSGLVCGLLATAVVVSLQHGPLAWLSQPWGALLPAMLALVVRVALGLVLAVGWLLPLLLGSMLASAALRRWGLPLLGLAWLVGAQWLDPRLPTPLVQPAIETMGAEALLALSGAGAFSKLRLAGGIDGQLQAELQAMPLAFWHEGLETLGRAASPGFALALAVGAACFAGLVWLRHRHT